MLRLPAPLPRWMAVSSGGQRAVGGLLAGYQREKQTGASEDVKLEGGCHDSDCVCDRGPLPTAPHSSLTAPLLSAGPDPPLVPV